MPCRNSSIYIKIPTSSGGNLSHIGNIYSTLKPLFISGESTPLARSHFHLNNTFQNGYAYSTLKMSIPHRTAYSKSKMKQSNYATLAAINCGLFTKLLNKLMLN